MPDIRQNKLWSIVGYFEFDQVEIWQAISPLKPHILCYSNGLAIWHCLEDIRYNQVIMADNRGLSLQRYAGVISADIDSHLIMNTEHAE